VLVQTLNYAQSINQNVYVGQVTSIDTDSTASLPHDDLSSAVVRSDTDKHDVDQSQPGTDGSEMTSLAADPSTAKTDSDNTDPLDVAAPATVGSEADYQQCGVEEIAKPADAVDESNEVDGGTAETSSGDTDSDVLALTYLLHPPDGSAFDRPYVDDFWTCRWTRMESEIRRLLRKTSRLASDVITLDSSSSSESSSSSDYDDYEDSLASNSPILVDEKSTVAGAVNQSDEVEQDEIILDENSSNAIVLGDDDDDDDEIECSGEAGKNGDPSTVVCDDVEPTNTSCSVADGVDSCQPVDTESTNTMESTNTSCVEPTNRSCAVADGVDSSCQAVPDVSSKLAVNGGDTAGVLKETADVRNGSVDCVEDS